jgi:hypothetical protein
MALSSVSGTGNQAYTSERIDYLARYMQTQLPGLDYNIAVRWIRAEQGVNGNVLGVTYVDAQGARRLRTYGSQEAGIRAAVSLLRSSSNYAGIRAALGQSYAIQARAITASPWNKPNSPYYARIFGINLPRLPGTGTTGVLMEATASETTLAALLDLPADMVVDLTTIKVITARIKEYQASGKLSAEVADTLLNVVGGLGVASSHGTKSTLGSVRINPDTGHTETVLSDVAAGIGDVFAFLFDSENWQYLAAIAVGVPLALLGFYLLAGVETGNA